MRVTCEPRRSSRAPVAAVAAIALALAASACSARAGEPAVDDGDHAAAASTTGSRPANAPVVLVVMENHEASAIVGSSEAPYMNRRLIAGGRVFTRYTAVAHPSLPNYLAMTSGATQGKAGSDAVSAGGIRARNLFHELSRAHVRWRAFEETMPVRCYRPYSAGSAPGRYALKHDPAMAYASVAGSTLCRRVVPLSALDPARLPAFSFVTPNECSDMHSCGIATGDRWLSRHIPPLLSAGAIVLVTFDEGTTDAGGGGRVLLVEDGPGIRPGVANHHPFDHYSLLAALERRFGVRLLGAARTSTPIPLPGRPGR
jgi:hypothetical protein